MSPAPQPPGRSPPARLPLRLHAPRPVILPPSPHASRSFVLAATRLRALHLDPHRATGGAEQQPQGQRTIP
jgi:hypothetical protein